MYAKVDKKHYQKVTGNARAAILAGRFTASVIAQVLVSFEWMNIRDLNFLTLGGKQNFTPRSPNFPKLILFRSSIGVANRRHPATLRGNQPLLLLCA